MSMTKEEAIKWLEEIVQDTDTYWGSCSKALQKELDEQKQVFLLALSALRHQIWEEKLWHDAKTDPPKTPGLYYGKKDDTNSMYPCLYRDGIWVLDAYPQTKMDIVKWADYTAFVKEDD